MKFGGFGHRGGEGFSCSLAEKTIRQVSSKAGSLIEIPLVQVCDESFRVGFDVNFAMLRATVRL